MGMLLYSFTHRWEENITGHTAALCPVTLTQGSQGHNGGKRECEECPLIYVVTGEAVAKRLARTNDTDS